VTPGRGRFIGIAAKRLQLFKDAVPRISRVAVLTNPDEPFADAQWKALELAAQILRMALQVVRATMAPATESCSGYFG